MSGFSGKREHVGEEHDFGHEEGHNGGRGHGGEVQAVLAQHESAVEQHDVEGDEEEGQHFQELVLHFVPELGHGVSVQ